jgi:acyl-CoA thioester hydrolase
MDQSKELNKQVVDIVHPFIRKANYYETDQMGIIHHSNYIRWFEEARIYYLEQIGLSYDKMEELGIISPVLGVTCEYKSSVRFNDTVSITSKIEYFNGLKMTISYEIKDLNTGILRALGESKHCFLSREFKPINMKKQQMDMFNILREWATA